MFSCQNWNYNFESPRRSNLFVTQKIIRGLIDIKKGKLQKLKIGNIQSERDWFHASDAAKACYLTLTANNPKNYVVGSGELNSIEHFIDITLDYLNIKYKKLKDNFSLKPGKNNIPLYYSGNKCIIESTSDFFRKKDFNKLVSDSKLIRRELEWKTNYKLFDIIKDMVNNVS